MRQLLDSFPREPAVRASTMTDRYPGDVEEQFKLRPASGPKLSAVVPFYNEGENILGVLGELRSTLDGLNFTYEVLAVDDGSTDDTGLRLQQIAGSWPQLCVLSHAKNSGQAAALWSGFQKATGGLVAVLDGDGQNDPSALGAMISHLSAENADMVAGVRAKRRDSLLRRSMSRTANRVRQIFLKDGVSDSGCALKVMRREVCGAFIPLRTLYSFMPALAVGAGFKVVEMAVPHRERTAGLSKYGLLAMLWRPALDMLGVWWFSNRRFPTETFHE
jgi:dolichol-phosphate mannosyltransferase